MGLGMWIFMLVCNLLVPLIMIGIGWAWTFGKKPPRDINGVYGYRTSMSMKNQDTWDFAHQVCGQIWWKVGLALLVFTVAFFGWMLPRPELERMAVLLYMVPEIVEVVVMLATIIPVERALSKQFNKDGSRR